MATKPTSAKTAKPASRPAGAKAARPKAQTPEEMPAEAAAPAAKANAALKLKALIDRVTETSGAKRKDVKTVVEATLIQLGEALARGEAMNLPGLGHLRVARKATPEMPTMTLKLRQGEAGKGKSGETDDSASDDEKEPLAADSDQG
ncbi:hypothetical protein GC209_04835 [bacterium]|nr:hypothetical protein [bacterium]